MAGIIGGEAAISSYIASHFLEQETLVTLLYGKTTVAQFMMVVDGTEPEIRTIDHSSDEEASKTSDQERDQYAKSLTIFGEVIEAIEATDKNFVTETTFIIDDSRAFFADVDDQGDVY